jgi:hypothetical protein
MYRNQKHTTIYNIVGWGMLLTIMLTLGTLIVGIYWTIYRIAQAIYGALISLGA